MKAGIDPEFEATVTRLLHSLRADSRVQPWPSPTGRVEQAVRRQNRGRASAAAAGVALAVAASAVGVAVAMRTPDTRSPVGGVGTAVPTVALPTSAAVAPQPTANPSAGIVVPSARLSRAAAWQASESAAVAAAEASPPDTTPIPASALGALRTFAWHQANLWGDEAATITAVHVANSTAFGAAVGTLGTPTLNTYVVQVKGQLFCRGCVSLGMMPLRRFPALYFYIDAHTLRETSAGYGYDPVDLSRFGVVSTIPPINASATPRPIGPTLAPIVTGHELTEQEATAVALQGADDPTRASVLWVTRVTNAQLKALKYEQQGASDLTYYVVAISGPRTSEGGTLTQWAAIVPERWSGGAATCGPDWCGVVPPAPH